MRELDMKHLEINEWEMSSGPDWDACAFCVPLSLIKVNDSIISKGFY